jgi:hypothetical protein
MAMVAFVAIFVSYMQGTNRKRQEEGEREGKEENENEKQQKVGGSLAI